ncbi:MAG: HmuY family protein [Tannerella sp.]|jgi:hypothetical protein|nr:HmuY family protein [Tannerella sp.]
MNKNKNTTRTTAGSGIFILCLLLLSSCDINQLWDKDHLFSYLEPQDGVFMYDCSDYTQWYFFSFEEGGIIGSCDAMDLPANEEWGKRTDWDLAFHRQNIKSNSGVSGDGSGGIMEYTQDEFDFDAVFEAPETGYIIDVPDSVIYDMSQMMSGKIGYAYTGVNPVTKNWAVLTDMMSGLWTYAAKTFIVRTATGNYAKIHLMNFKSDRGASGTVTMKYVYQADGTINLDINKLE